MKSICVDTNIIIRHLVDGDNFLIELINSGVSIVIPVPIWLETVFVLEKVYSVPRSKIVENLRELLTDPAVIIKDLELLEIMFQTYQADSSLSIVDCFILQYSLIGNFELQSYNKKLVKIYNNLSKK
jgi:predicted nucleic acid-binding protein